MDMESKHLTPGACEECTEGCGKKLSLLNASRLGHLNCLNACLTAGADVNFLFIYEIFGTPLNVAMEYGYDDCVEALIKAGALVSKVVPGENGSERCVNLILEAGGDADRMLRDAAYHGRDNIVELLVKAGARIDNTISFETTVLHVVAEKGSEKCVNLILEAGGNPTEMLHTAVRKRRGNIVHTLIKAGADVNTKVGYGCKTALFAAVENIDLSCAKILLRGGVKVNVKGSNCFYALTVCLTDYTPYRPTSKELEEFVMLLFAAGDTPDGGMRWAHKYFKPSAEINLINICRETIRKHLLKLDDVNLFIRVPQLPLPQLMTSYLLYDVTLDC